MKRLLTLSLFLFFYDYSSAQTHYRHNVFWGRVVLADKITDKLKAELQIQRRTQNTDEASNMFAMPQFKSYWLWLNYSFSPTTKLSVSPFGYFETNILYVNPLDVDKPAIKEFRWVVRFEQEQKFKFFNYANRYSVEYRSRDLLSNHHYLPNWRLRYMAKLEKPIKWKWLNGRALSFIINDEVMFQYGTAVKDNPSAFDQNRIYGGFSYEVVKNVKLNLGYLYTFQQRPAGDEYDNVNTIWAVLTFDNLFSQFKKAK